MLLQELLTHKIDLKRAKLIRHAGNKEKVYENYRNGYIDIHQRIQDKKRFANCDYVVSFLGVGGSDSKFLGIYSVAGFEPFKRDLLPAGYYALSDYGESVFWNLAKTDILTDLVERLIIDWGKSTLSWCQNGDTGKEISQILPRISPYVFTSYDKVLLQYTELKHIVSNPKENAIWQNKLSSVAGVYLITDTSTGKQYVGSASGETGGIWGRWSEYAKTKHGDNKRLKELMAAAPEHCNNFQYSILEVFPIKRDKNEILEYEALYKQKLATIKFGLNDN